MVGQEQVTTPLSAALDAGRINHAYLFSGPRGCGKTSSARIMARSLNCEHGPTSTPCGVCDSCVSLAPGGPGNLDVTELDAASHNGVEDMRELRDRAYYAPAESRYRIFIIDEAHMISASGANALLKVVEEPPEHVIFIFATTEPEKIIGTIRSRTHHYPFRLLTPPAMNGLLERTVAAEGVHVDDSVYPMVIQAGGGSPRDTLSILDQLLAGAGPDGLTYDVARPLLGVTDLGLLDNTIEALASQDKAGLFRLVDGVIEAGHEPRRFAIDLLDRLRDLMILQAVPTAVEEGLVSAPTDRGEILSAQAQRFSGPQLAYLAETVNDRISTLRGATSPRLLLEILCAHLLVGSAPAAAAAGSGVQLPQGMPGGAQAPKQTQTPTSAQAQSQGAQAPAQSAVASAQDPAAAAAAILASRRNRQAQQEEQAQQEQQAQQAPAPEQPQHEPALQPEAQQPQAQPTQAEAHESPEQLAERVRGQWADLRVRVGRRNKIAEIMLAEARVLGIRDDILVLGHTTGALAQRINAPENNKDIVAVLKEEYNRDLQVECIIGTDPKAAGFSGQQPVTRQAWNPNQAQRESAEPEQEPESPSPQTDPQSQPERAPEAPAQGAAPAEESADPWGVPRPIGRGAQPQPEPERQTQQQQQQQPRPQPQRQEQPQQPPRVQAQPQQQPQRQEQPQQQVPDWRSRIARATESAAARDAAYNAVPKFGDGVPLPPEPAPEGAEYEPPFEAPPEEYYPPEDAGGQQGASPSGAPQAGQQYQPQSQPQQQQQPAQPYTRDDEEREMMEAARDAGELDHRTATEVAMELLTQELGARRL